MARMIELLIVFALSVNLFAGIMITSGAAADVGLDGALNTGGDKAVNDAQSESSDLSTGAPTGSTLFGMYNVLAGFLGTVRGVVFGLPAMLYNLGTPSWLTEPMEVVFGVVYALGIAKFLRGI